MFDKMHNLIMDLPKSIIDWLHINDSTVVYLTYFVFGLLAVETLFEIFISRRFFVPTKRFESMRNFMRNGIKIFPMLLVILSCDPFIIQHFPFLTLDKEMAEMFVIVLIVVEALLISSLLHELLWFIHAGVNLLTKGESKTFEINDAYNIPTAVAAIVFTKLQQVVIMISLLLNVIVLYYNYLL